MTDYSKLDAQMAAMSDEELKAARDKQARWANAMSAGYMADLSVGRYEPPSMAAESYLSRSFEQSARATSVLRRIDAEIARRKA